MVFTQTAAFNTEQCTSSSLFHNFEVSRGGSYWSLKNYVFISDTNLQNFLHVHKSFINETIIIQDCWIRNTLMCMKTERVFGIHCWLCVWRKPGQWFFSQCCIHHRRLENQQWGVRGLQLFELWFSCDWTVLGVAFQLFFKVPVLGWRMATKFTSD